VITVDVSLPDGDGVMLVNELHAVVPDTPVIVMSALEPEGVSTRAADAGAAGFLRKDEPLETILACLVRAAAREAINPPRPRPVPPGRRARTATEERLRYLTPRETEVLVHILDGESTKTMAKALGISYTTTRTHVQNVLQKLGVSSRLQASALIGPERAELGLDGPGNTRLMPLAYPHVPRG
jgi:DNA-binding NarL/FixJ family response regulator